jgi:hypothetical protein
VIIKAGIKPTGIGKSIGSSVRFFNGKRVLIPALLAACICFPTAFFAGGYFSKKEFASSIIIPIVNRTLQVPLHFLSGLTITLDRLDVKMKQDDLLKLSEMRKKQKEEGLLFISKDDFVPAVIQWNEEKAKVSIRFIGLAPVCGRDSEKWAFEVRLKGNAVVSGVRSFSLRPLLPEDFTKDWLFREILDKACGFACTKMQLVKLAANSINLGTYVVEEEEDRSLFVENENDVSRRAVTFNEYLLMSNDSDNLNLAETGFQEMEIGRKMLSAFREKQTSAGQVFEIKKLARVFATLDLCGYKYTTAFSHIRFSYDPAMKVLEPITYDCSFPLRPKPLEYTSKLMKSMTKEKPEFIPLTEYQAWYEAFYNDTVFSSEYVRRLDSILQPDHFNAFISSILPKFERQLKRIYKTNPGFLCGDMSILLKNREYLLKQIQPPQTLQAYFRSWDSVSNVLTLQLGNIQGLPVKIMFVQYKTIKANRMSFDDFIAPKAPFALIKFKDFQFKMPGKIALNMRCVDSMSVFYSLIGSSRMESETIFPWSYLDEDGTETQCLNY